MTEYRLLASSETRELDLQVTELIVNGEWELYGSPFAVQDNGGTVYYCQAVIRKTQP